MKGLLILSLAVLVTSSVEAQERDSLLQRAEEARLRAQIEQRFAERVHQDLSLTPDQAKKLSATQQRFASRRRALMQQQRERHRALDDQMQPGVAANSDSVRKLMDGIRDGRAEMLKLEQEQDQEMAGYLTPVQRARYQQIRERFMQRVNELQMERREGRGMPPRMTPRPRLRGGRRGPGI